jgi:hypothetical protein
VRLEVLETSKVQTWGRVILMEVMSFREGGNRRLNRMDARIKVEKEPGRGNPKFRKEFYWKVGELKVEMEPERERVVEVERGKFATVRVKPQRTPPKTFGS